MSATAERQALFVAFDGATYTFILVLQASIKTNKVGHPVLVFISPNHTCKIPFDMSLISYETYLVFRSD